MEGIDKQLSDNTQKETKSNSKRKWREIEAIKDKITLKKELDSYDNPLSYYSDLIS